MSGPSLLWVNHFAVTPADGGGTRHYDLARTLARLGWTVTVAGADFHLHGRRYTRRAGASDRRTILEQLEGVRFAWLWSAPYAVNDWRRVHNWLSFAWRVALADWSAPRPDVVIGSSPHLFAALGAWWAARRLGVPFVMEVRDLWPESMEAVSGRRGLLYHTLDRLAGFLYARADRVVVLARGSVERLRARGVPASRIAYVPNGVDPRGFPEVTRVARPCRTLVYAGAHGPANGLDVVLEAAERLQGRDLRFRFVGDGPSRGELEAHAERRGLANVEFHGSVPKSAVPAVLAEADAGLMVLRDTPLFADAVSPNKLFDYLAAALPVVCNVPGEVARMVAEAGAGEQAADASAAALADAVLRLAARSPEERVAMGRAGRTWVLREHSRDVLGARLDDVLSPLLARRMER